jgi:sugar phosphate isomerase/epimerase
VPGFELGIYPAWYGHLAEVISDLRESGLSFPVVHAEKLIGAGLGSATADEPDEALERLVLNCRAAAALGAKTLVVHLWERPTGDEVIERNLEHLPACLDTAEAYGLTLAVETIPGDVGTPLANVRLALERDPRCRVALDTEFLGLSARSRRASPRTGSGTPAQSTTSTSRTSTGGSGGTASGGTCSRAKARSTSKDS